MKPRTDGTQDIFKAINTVLYDTSLRIIIHVSRQYKV